jgi:hypothetical protein
MTVARRKDMFRCKSTLHEERNKGQFVGYIGLGIREVHPD